MNLRCFNCGFETDNRGLFLCNQGNGTQSWMVFACPQCDLSNPPVGEIPLWNGEISPWPNPKWEVTETGEGLYVFALYEKGGKSGKWMIPEHQLWNAPAWLLRPELEGTFADHHKRLIVDGKARSAAFKADYERWDAENPAPGNQVARVAAMDESRKRHGVGSHYKQVSHDGPTLMRRAGLEVLHLSIVG